jgi:TnsA endonuclease N terminal
MKETTAPVRKPTNKSGSHIIGKYPSIKVRRMVLFESTIERDLLYLLDYAAGITALTEQPLTIEYTDEGQTRHYTPDFLAVQTGCTFLIECKPEDRVNDPDNQRCFAAGQAYCAAQGWRFAIITDRALRAGYRLRNIKLLRQFAPYEVAPQIRGAIYGVMQGASSPLSIAQIKTALTFPPAVAQTALFYMAYHHEIGLPVETAPISDQTPVYCPGQLAEAHIL